MTLSVSMVTCDTTEPRPLATWWAEQLGGTVVDEFGGYFVMVVGGPVRLAFQLVDDPTPGKNLLHLDLTADDLEAEVERLLAAGASMVGRRGEEGFRWVTLTDPQGHEFCVAGREEAEGAMG
jgi:hypothetical protein